MRVFRKNYFVNPRLQVPLILGANVLALVSIALIVTLYTLMQAQLQGRMVALGLPLGQPLPDLLARFEAEYLRICIVIGSIQFVLFNATAIFLAHRIAGPLYRLERHLTAVGEGKEPSDVSFRKGDLYQGLAEACNGVMARLRQAQAKP
jgi:hypothetical protein